MDKIIMIRDLEPPWTKDNHYTEKELREMLDCMIKDGAVIDTGPAGSGEGWYIEFYKSVEEFHAEGIYDPAVICALGNLYPEHINPNLRVRKIFN